MQKAKREKKTVYSQGIVMKSKSLNLPTLS